MSNKFTNFIALDSECQLKENIGVLMFFQISNKSDIHNININWWKVQDIQNLNYLMTQMSVLRQWFNKIVLKIQLEHIFSICALVFTKFYDRNGYW